MIKDEPRDTWHRTRQTMVAAVRTFYIFFTARPPPFSGHPRFVFPPGAFSSEPRGRRGGGRHSRNPDFRHIICTRLGKMPAVNAQCCATPRVPLRGRVRTAKTLSSLTPLGKLKRNRRKSPALRLKFCPSFCRAAVCGGPLRSSSRGPQLGA